jgi:hypothetical protein
MKLAHLGQASFAIFPIEQGDDGGHDRTPLFDQRFAYSRAKVSAYFRRWTKMASGLFRAGGPMKSGRAGCNGRIRPPAHALMSNYGGCDTGRRRFFKRLMPI